jgi:hypothetical protein
VGVSERGSDISVAQDSFDDPYVAPFRDHDGGRSVPREDMKSAGLLDIRHHPSLLTSFFRISSEIFSFCLLRNRVNLFRVKI